ncbi:hypothetical protein T03_7910, partial [Trichinella britovi]
LHASLLKISIQQMSKATVFLLLLFVWLTESILFTPYDFDIITRGIAALHGNVSPLNYHYNPKNACQVLSDVADQQLKWIRNSNINPPSLRKDYLKVVRKIKKDAKVSGRRHEDLLQCQRMLNLYYRPPPPFRPRPLRPIG